MTAQKLRHSFTSIRLCRAASEWIPAICEWQWNKCSKKSEEKVISFCSFRSNHLIYCILNVISMINSHRDSSEFLLRCVCTVWCGRQCECMAANKWVNAANLPYHSQLSTRVWNHCEEPSWPTKPNPICKIVPFHLISWNYFVCNVDSSVSFEHDNRFGRPTHSQWANGEQCLGHRRTILTMGLTHTRQRTAIAEL